VFLTLDSLTQPYRRFNEQYETGRSNREGRMGTKGNKEEERARTNREMGDV